VLSLVQNCKKKKEKQERKKNKKEKEIRKKKNVINQIPRNQKTKRNTLTRNRG